MAKPTYKIPFFVESGSLLEWVNPDIISGKFPIPTRWYDMHKKCFIGEPSKPFPPRRSSLADDETWAKILEAYDQDQRRFQAETAVFNDRVKDGRYVQRHVYRLVDNYSFRDTLSFIGYSRGRSSAKIDWISATTGAEYGMFLTDFEELVKKVGFNALDGRGVNAEFTFCKRGQNYGIKLKN